MPACQVRRVERQVALGLGVVRYHGREADRTNVDRPAVVRPHGRGILRGIAGVRELNDQAERHRLRRQTRLQVVHQEAGRFRLGLGVGEVEFTGHRGDPVSSRGCRTPFLFTNTRASLAKNDSVAKLAGTVRLSTTNFSARVRGEERLDRPGVGLDRVGRHNGLLELQELLPRPDDEPVVRHGDDVGLAPAGQGEPDRHPAGAGVGRVIRDAGVRRALGEPNGYG